MLPKYHKIDIIFLLSLMIIIVFVETTSVELQHSKKGLEASKIKSPKKEKEKSTPQRKTLEKVDLQDKYMRINNNFQIRGNITSSRILTKTINITGQAIVAKSSTAQEIDADKIGVQTIYVNEIKSPNVIIK